MVGMAGSTYKLPPRAAGSVRLEARHTHRKVACRRQRSDTQKVAALSVSVCREKRQPANTFRTRNSKDRHSK